MKPYSTSYFVVRYHSVEILPDAYSSCLHRPEYPLSIFCRFFCIFAPGPRVKCSRCRYIMLEREWGCQGRGQKGWSLQLLMLTTATLITSIWNSDTESTILLIFFSLPSYLVTLSVLHGPSVQKIATIPNKVLLAMMCIWQQHRLSDLCHMLQPSLADVAGTLLA